jgi:26S proteasome regulatory subunit N10
MISFNCLFATSLFKDAVNLVCHSKTRANPENNVGLITMAGKRIEVLSTLTSEAGRILAKLHQV